MLLVRRGEPRIYARGAGFVRMLGRPARFGSYTARLDGLPAEVRGQRAPGRLGRG
jgi:hypothetical protein